MAAVHSGERASTGPKYDSNSRATAATSSRWHHSGCGGRDFAQKSATVSGRADVPGAYGGKALSFFTSFIGPVSREQRSGKEPFHPW